MSHEIITTELAPEAVERLRLLQYLSQAPDRATYLQRQRAVAKQLGVTVRNVQRLARAWQQSGLAGIVRHPRSDRGDHRISDEWQEYILKTYRQGNRGRRQMSRGQVAVRVAARAAEMGDSTYPSRATVYRVLQSEIDKQAQARQKRSFTR